MIMCSFVESGLQMLRTFLRSLFFCVTVKDVEIGQALGTIAV